MTGQDLGLGSSFVVLALVLAILLGRLMTGLLTKEVTGWLPLISARIIQRAARRLPTEHATRWEEEALNHLRQYADRPLSGLIHATQMWFSVRELLQEIEAVADGATTPGRTLGERAKAVRDRIIEGMIVMTLLLADVARRLLRPSATAAALLICVYVALVIAEATGFPSRSTWEPGTVASTVSVMVGVAAMSISLLVIVAYRRAHASRDDEPEFHKVARAMASLVVESDPSLHTDQVLVHVWTVSGLRGLRTLRSRAFAGPVHLPVPIMWTKGKGVIGSCWARNKVIHVNLDELRPLIPSEVNWQGLSHEQRFGLTWQEFGAFYDFGAVIAAPLRTGAFGRSRVRGVLEIQVLTPARIPEYLPKTREFRSLVQACEAVLSGYGALDPEYPADLARA